MDIVDIVPGLIIGLREGIEAALVIGIVLGYLAKIGRQALSRYVLGGTAGAIVASALVAAVLFVVAGGLPASVEPIYEGVAMILAVAVLTSMLFWMMTASKNIKVHVQQRLDQLLSRPQMLGLVVLSFIMVFREGVETALFMYGAGALTSPAAAVLGVALGLVIAGVVGVGLVRASWRFNLKRFFQVTGVLLVVIAAGLFSNGIHELQEGFGWTLGSAVVYDWSAFLPDESANILGSLLHGLVGYRDAPTILEVVAYGAYWAFAVALYLGIRTGRLSGFLSRLRSSRRSATQAGADTEST